MKSLYCEANLIQKSLKTHPVLSLTIVHPIPTDDPFLVEACRTIVFGLDAYNKHVTGILPKRQLFVDHQGSPKLIADIRQYALEFENSNVDILETIISSNPEFLSALEAFAYAHGARRAFSWCYKNTPLFDVFVDAGYIPTGEFPDFEVNAIVQRFYKDLISNPARLDNPVSSRLSLSDDCDADYTQVHVTDLLNNSKSFGIFLFDPTDQSIKGGILGYIYKAENKGIPCGYINFLWVDGSYRSQNSQTKRGLGKMLMMHAEKLFKQQGVTYAQVTTNGFQAPGFYEKLCYTMVKSCPGHLILESGSYDVFEGTKKL